MLSVFQRNTLVNRLRARREFYTVFTKPGENVLAYIFRVRQKASILKLMGVILADSEMAMAVVNGLPDHYDYFISAFDAVGDENLSLHLVKCRLRQEEKRSSMTPSATRNETELCHARRRLTIHRKTNCRQGYRTNHR